MAVTRPQIPLSQDWDGGKLQLPCGVRHTGYRGIIWEVEPWRWPLSMCFSFLFFSFRLAFPFFFVWKWQVGLFQKISRPISKDKFKSHSILPFQKLIFDLPVYNISTLVQGIFRIKNIILAREIESLLIYFMQLNCQFNK